MSTVKIKREPAEPPATAATAVDVQVKLEPSLSTNDIKLEQHASDIDTKIESDSEAGSEEEDIKSENDNDSDDDTDQFTITPKNQRQFICKHPRCGRGFNTSFRLNIHQHEHRLQADLTIYGKTYILTRQSLDDRWPCPLSDCETTWKSVCCTHVHIQKVHSASLKKKRSNIEDDDDNNHQQLQVVKKKQYNVHYLNVDDFYICGTRCGYHTTTGLFICHKCKLVPECLLAHLQQKHGYDEKLINSSVLPESARIIGSDPNINQYTSNPHLVSAISQPSQPQHPDIVQGWLCVTANCGYCHSTKKSIYQHQRNEHKDEQLSMVKTLVLQLTYSKTQSLCFLITRLETIANNIETYNSTSQHIGEGDGEEDDGDELVLSDYSDYEDDIY